MAALPRLDIVLILAVPLTSSKSVGTVVLIPIKPVLFLTVILVDNEPDIPEEPVKIAKSTPFNAPNAAEKTLPVKKPLSTDPFDNFYPRQRNRSRYSATPAAQ